MRKLKSVGIISTPMMENIAAQLHAAQSKPAEEQAMVVSEVAKLSDSYFDAGGRGLRRVLPKGPGKKERARARKRAEHAGIDSQKTIRRAE